MKTTGLWLLLGVLAAGSAAQAALRPQERTVSASRQFVVYNADPLVAASICARAEKLKRGWLRLLGLTDQWRDPIVVWLAEDKPLGGATPGLGLQILSFEGQLRYQIRCQPPVDEEALGAVLVEALSREYANRGLPLQPSVPRQSAFVPLWLSTAFAEVVAERHDQLLPVLQRSVAAGRPGLLRPVLEASLPPADEAERPLFRAHCWLLLDSLLLLPKGQARLRQWLAVTSLTHTGSAAFAAQYGAEVGEGVAQEKWWALQLARKSRSQLAQALTATETAQELDSLLRLQLRDPLSGMERTVGFGQWADYAEEPWFGELSAERSVALQLLRGRSHPRYQPVAASYLEALDQLRQQAFGRFRSVARRAARERMAADRHVQKIRDYLDQAERLHGPVSAESLRQYQRTLESIERQRPPDPLRQYLDQFDRFRHSTQ